MPSLLSGSGSGIFNYMDNNYNNTYTDTNNYQNDRY